MVQALTRHPFTQKPNKYCIFNCKKIGLLLSKANGVYRVESLIFRKNILMSWSFAEFTVFGEIRLLTLSCHGDALPVGRVCLVGSRGGVVLSYSM